MDTSGVFLMNETIGGAGIFTEDSQSFKTPLNRRSNKTVCQKSKSDFYGELLQFHEKNSTPIIRFPRVGGKEVDLYLLYTSIIGRGGWQKVNLKDEWDSILKEMCIPDACANVTTALKQIYVRYLERYEKFYFLGESLDRADDDDDDAEATRHKKLSTRSLHSVPQVYNYMQHHLSDATRIQHNLFEHKKSSEHDKVVLSLLSPLPNEQDFAINVCTLLANEGRQVLRLQNGQRLVNALLAHAGLFQNSALRRIFTQYYFRVRKHYLETFWRDCLLSKPQMLELAFEEIFDECAANQKLAKDDSLLLEYISNNNSDLAECEFLALSRSIGIEEYVGQRVQQIATIFRNLSFTEENCYPLVQNRTFLRFAVMLANVEWNGLHHIGLDMLGNISNDLELNDPATDHLSRSIMSTVVEGLDSKDRGVIISCLEILSKICHKESNEDYIHKCMKRQTYETISVYLSLNDIMLLLYALECIYSLSSLGEVSCNHIVHIRGIVDTLVSLVTVEAQSYGSDACILMRVVETIPNTMHSSSQALVSNRSQVVTQQLSIQNEPISSIPATITIQQAPDVLKLMSVPTSTVEEMQTAHQACNFSLNKTVASPEVKPNVTLAPQERENLQNSLSTKHQHQQLIQENEQFVYAWLKTAVEPAKNLSFKIDQQELYKLYVNASQKIGRRGVLSPLHFPRCVRSVFGGTVGPNQIKENGSDTVQSFYEGLKMKVVDVLATKQNQELNLDDQQPFSITSEKTESNKSTSLIIKNLLANKVTTFDVDSKVSTLASLNTPAFIASNSNINKIGNCVKTTVIATNEPIRTGLATNPPPLAPLSTSKSTPLIKQEDNQMRKMDENAQKANANKMLADLLEKKSDPPIFEQGIKRQIDKTSDPAETSTKKVCSGETGDQPKKAADLYAELAGSILEDEDVEEVSSNSSSVPEQKVLLTVPKSHTQKQIITVPVPLQRQIIVSSNNHGPMVLQGQNIVNSQATATMKTESGLQTVPIIFQPPSNQQTIQIQKPAGQATQTNVLTPGQNQPQQYILTTNTQGQTYVVAQPPNAQLQQTVLLAQSQQNNAQKTIIILQQGGQPLNLGGGSNPSTPQKILMATSQGQQLLVTQSPRQQLIMNQQPSGNNVVCAQTQSGQKIFIARDDKQPGKSQVIFHQKDQGQVGNQILIQATPSNQQPLLAMMSAQKQQAVVSARQGLISPKAVATQQKPTENPSVTIQKQAVFQMNTAKPVETVNSSPGIGVPSNAPLQIQLKTIPTMQRPASQPAQTVAASDSKEVLKDADSSLSSTSRTSQETSSPKTTQDVVQSSENAGRDSNSQIIQILSSPETLNMQEEDVEPSWLWICDWRGCPRKKFKSANEVYLHACAVHCPDNLDSSSDIYCQWGPGPHLCDNLPRKRFSLMTHIFDRHCMPEAFKTAMQRRLSSPETEKSNSKQPYPVTLVRQQPSQSGGNESDDSKVKRSPAPNQNGNAALQAIKRHNMDRSSFKEPIDNNEGPVTKSIRLTAALTLRNLVNYSQLAKRNLKSYEPHLANVALSNVESSRTIAQVLYEMNETHHI